LVARTEKEGYLGKMKLKMKLQELRKVFSAIVRARKRETEMQQKTELFEQ